MTVITAGTHTTSRRAPIWGPIVAVAVLLAGLVTALVLAFTGSSSDDTAPARTTVVTDTGGGSGGPSLCPGSKKDWTC